MNAPGVYNVNCVVHTTQANNEHREMEQGLMQWASSSPHVFVICVADRTKSQCSSLHLLSDHSSFFLLCDGVKDGVGHARDG